jgi:PhnB protein
MTVINPYLNFNGNCGEAFNFYKSVLGGEFSVIQKFKDVPSDHPMPEVEGEQIMHVSLPVGQGTILMGSDRPASMGKPVPGENFSLSLTPETEAEADRLFNGLAAGGKVTMPLAKAFWGAYFGMLTDKFGINWMINCEQNNS